MLRSNAIAVVVWCFLGSAASAQPAPEASFEVASVKPVDARRGVLFDFSSSGPRVRYRGYGIVQLIMEAYHVESYQVTFAPSVVAPAGGVYDAYDIEAKAPGDAPRSRNDLRPMLQSLLAERFHLQLHRGQKGMPVYLLTVGKNGPKFQESRPDATASAHIGVKGQNQTVTAVKQSAHEIGEWLRNVFFLDRPVVDRTGLTGMYDFAIEATPQPNLTREDPELRSISAFTAVQQQLGLKLEQAKAPVEVLVVDRVERLSAN